MSGFLSSSASIKTALGGPGNYGTRAYGTTITVDPVNGDDSLSNDGTVTPLKTLDALFKRLPVSATGQVDDDVNSSTSLLIILKTGDHTFSRNLQGSPSAGYADETQLPANTTIRGEWITQTSFQIDHFTNIVHVYQAATQPGWTVNQWQGMFLQTSADGYYPILANDAYDLTVGWSPDDTSASGGNANWSDPYGGPALGSTVSIVSLGTRLIGPSALWFDGVYPILEYLYFDGVPNSMTNCLGFSATGGYLKSCRLSGSSHSPIEINSYGEFCGMWNCLIDNSGVGIYANGDGNWMSNCSFLNISDTCIWMVAQSSINYSPSCFHAPDASTCIHMSELSTLLFDSVGVRVNTSSTFIDAYGGHGATDVSLTGNPTVVESMVPKTWFGMSPLSRFVIDPGFNVASSTAADAIRLDDGTYKSIADWVAASKKLTGGKGGIIIGW